jgi:hypothetical protein
LTASDVLKAEPTTPTAVVGEMAVRDAGIELGDGVSETGASTTVPPQEIPAEMPKSTVTRAASDRAVVICWIGPVRDYGELR